eukprot:TRINITY_DN31712_c0_g1_i1.p1 TRINITY_DN31712_c0_g1~~TRINITY_DN31712_c0_g1_i1.p1  ORF type:complete len:241 (+),score=60.05 TRINITY_DN31712_c0_g1_i1:60-725(+)
MAESFAACAASAGTALPPAKKPRPRVSFSEEIIAHDDAVVAANAAAANVLAPVEAHEAGDVRNIHFGLLRLANVYRTSISLPPDVVSAEVLPSLTAGDLSAELAPPGQDAAARAPSLELTFAARREGKFAETLRLLLHAKEGDSGHILVVHAQGTVMGRDDGKPFNRKGIKCISEGKPEDYDTDAGTTWEGFGRGATATAICPDGDVDALNVGADVEDMPT